MMEFDISLSKPHMQRRLEGLNELREDVVKDRSLLIRGDTYYPKIEAIDKELDVLEKHVDQSEARTKAWLTAIGIGLVVFQIILRFWK